MGRQFVFPWRIYLLSNSSLTCVAMRLRAGAYFVRWWMPSWRELMSPALKIGDRFCARRTGLSSRSINRKSGLWASITFDGLVSRSTRQDLGEVAELREGDSPGSEIFAIDRQPAVRR